MCTKWRHYGIIFKLLNISDHVACRLSIHFCKLKNMLAKNMIYKNMISKIWFPKIWFPKYDFQKYDFQKHDFQKYDFQKYDFQKHDIQNMISKNMISKKLVMGGYQYPFLNYRDPYSKCSSKNILAVTFQITEAKTGNVGKMLAQACRTATY